MAEDDALDGIARELLALPIDEFTPTRNARVRQLRSSGERSLAARVQALRRPTPALWAANRLAQEQPELFSQVRMAANAAADAQVGTSAANLTESVTQLQRSLDDVARAGTDALQRAGHRASDDVVLRTRELVRLAALQSDETWERLLRGALTEEPEPNSGFGRLPATAAQPPSNAATDDQRASAARERERDAARRQAGDDAYVAELARVRAGQLRDEANRLTTEAAAANEEAAAAEREAVRAEGQAAQSRQVLEALGSDTPS